MERRSWGWGHLRSRVLSCPPTLPWCLEPCLTCFSHAVHQLSGSPWSGPSRGATPWGSARHRGFLPASRPGAQAGWPLGRQVHLNHRERTLITCLAHRYVLMSCKPATPRTAPAAQRPRMRSESPWSGLGCLPHGHCSVSKCGYIRGGGGCDRRAGAQPL